MQACDGGATPLGAAIHEAIDALLESFGDEAIGMISASPYTADLDTPSNEKFVAGMLRDYENLPGSTPPGSTSTAWWPIPRCKRPAPGPMTGTR